jgi:hypothetical protein
MKTFAKYALISLLVALPAHVASVGQEIVRLAPSAFSALSPTVRRDLERRGCRIPQSFARRDPHNVVRGRFTRAGQMDIAVLCSTGITSTILVFRGGTTSEVVELASQSDETFLQTIAADGRLGYSRALAVANSTHIRQHHAECGGLEPPTRIDHDGLEDIFVEKASVIWYWYRGRWLMLQGSD